MLVNCMHEPALLQEEIVKDAFLTSFDKFEYTPQEESGLFSIIPPPNRLETTLKKIQGEKNENK